jgi:hypothetical protein
MHNNYKYILAFFLIIFTSYGGAVEPKTTEYRGWIAEMKSSRKGPFIRIQWYCNDGEKLPPKAYACREHGGGHQHGELNRKAVVLQNKGYRLMSFLAGIDSKKTLRRNDFIDWYNQLLIQKFLISTNNGWVLKNAQFYRGAIQEEDERDGARQLLTALAEKPEWLKLRYLALRIGTQLLAHGEDTASVQKVRQMTVSLVEQDKDFSRLRNKIHVAPDVGNAELVRDYALKINNEQLKSDYMALAREIDRIYQSPPLVKLLESAIRKFRRETWLQNLLLESGRRYDSDNSAENHYVVTAHLLANLRDALPKIRHLKSRLHILDLSLAVEAVNFKASTQLNFELEKANRQSRLSWLQNAALSAYGTGYINQRSLYALNSSLNRLKEQQIPLETYFKELNYLSRAPGWSTQALRFQFYRSMIKLAEIEPIAKLFIQDMLRGSPMFFFSQTLDSLSRDVNHLAGVSHQLFGQPVGVGLHALNPGLARGKLYTQADINHLESFDPLGIYLLPETISDLPPVAGIITVGEGNSLSHVQLLARNLGIPNVTINQSLVQQLQQGEGETIVMAVSSKGLVELNRDSPEWQRFFNAKSEQQDIVIRPNLEKLDLTKREFIDLSLLRASDSGRIVGPKAAKLGELYHHYPSKVANGIAIPFGLFREAVLDKPYKNTDQTVFQWMESQYAIFDAFFEDPDMRKQAMESFRAEIYDVISNTEMGAHYQNELRSAMIKTFGSTNDGVFIRSDTNVEDLPGFTGAGLNLTLFNVVGMKNIIKGITKVWASPFSPRAFAWRQSLMELPQHVYPAILIMKTVANEKSGVMVTQDIETGEMGVLSVATNEGVGGAVDGQSAESLRIDTKDGSIRLLATATAPVRKVPLRKGGVVKLPVSGSDSVLKANEIDQLIQFAKDIPNTFPAIIDDKGNRAAADVEFGFYKGKLQLFQLRPFLQSKKAKSNSYLITMDKALQGNLDRLVSMTEMVE